MRYLREDRLARVFRVALLGITLVTLAADRLQAQSAPPSVSCRIENFFNPARPGDRVTITLRATRPGGLKGVTGFFNRSQYLSSAYKNEHMISLTFDPTGEPDEFRAQFLVPREDDGKKLPNGSYRFEITGGTDGAGDRFYCRYVPVGTMGFDSEPGVPWEGQMTGRYFPGQSPPKVELKICARTAGERKINYKVSVTNYFGQSVGDSQEGWVTAPGQGEVVRVPLTIAVPGEGDQYRLSVHLNDADGPQEQEIVRSLLTDITAGYRPELRLENSQWTLLPVDDAAAVMPEKGEWQPSGRTIGVARFTEAFGKNTTAVWLKTEFEVPEWLAGKYYEIYFEDVRYGCRVFLNGRYLDQHLGPLYPFSIDATLAVEPGKVNTLALCVFDTRLGEAAGYKGSRFSGRVLWPIPGYGYGGTGMIGEVRLRARPAVFLSDVFVMPQVSKGELALRVKVRNTSTAALEVVINPRVEDGDGVSLRMSPHKLLLDKGEERQVELVDKWPDAKLWWPHAPHLYRLRTALASADGTVLDEMSVRFGYREVKVAGRFIEFNGRRFKTRFLSGGGRPQSYEEALEYFTGKLRGAEKIGHSGPFLYRVHLMPSTPAMLDAADELGVLVENEGSLGGISSNLADTRTWKNYKQMLTDYFNRDKNHPSLVFWSVVNEILICTNRYPDLYGWNQDHLLELGRHLRALDPTRLIEFNGDADIDGTWYTMNLHYPRKWFNRADLPNSAFWLDYGAKNLPCDQSYPLSITWNKPKPIVIGEDGLFVAATLPHGMTSFGGDEVYRGIHQRGRWGAQPIDDAAHAMLIEGYRDAEVSVYSNLFGGTGGAACDRASIAVRFFVRERDSRFYGGETVQRRVSIHNDTLESANMDFIWRLVRRGKDIAKGNSAALMQAGELCRIEIDLPMPVVREKTPVELRASLERDGREVFSETYPYTVYPRRPFSVNRKLKLGVLDSAGATSAALAAGKVKFVNLSTPDSRTEAALGKLNCLLVGENGFGKTDMAEFQKVVTPFLEGGGVLIVLRHDDPQVFRQEWMPVSGLRSDGGRQTTISWPRSPGHPVLRQVDAGMLRYWRGDNIVSTGDFVKTPLAGWRPLVDAGGREGLEWSSLVEMQVGKGTVLVCQMRLVEKLEGEPAACIILENLLDYAASREPGAEIREVRVLSAENRLSNRLSKLGFTVTAGEDARVTVVDAAQPGDGEGPEALIADLQARLGTGGVVMLHGLTPDSLERWKNLLSQGTTLREVKSMHAAASRQHELLDGISGTDLWWSDLVPWDQAESGAIQVAYAVEDLEGATELVGPGALTAIAVGQGLLLVDQMQWEQKEVHPGRSGQYLALLLGNLLRRTAP